MDPDATSPASGQPANATTSVGSCSSGCSSTVRYSATVCPRPPPLAARHSPDAHARDLYANSTTTGRLASADRRAHTVEPQRVLAQNFPLERVGHVVAVADGGHALGPRHVP